jgi:TatD DNase family protein
MLIDTHCHLADAAFADDLAAVVERAARAGLTTALCILSADEPEEVARASEVRALWPGVLFSAGVHPHRAGGFSGRPEAAATAAGAAATAASAVAIGEIGLDYHYDFSPRDVQRDVFAAQVAYAGLSGLPVVIHTREATEDTLAVVRDARPAIAGVLHCFTGDVAEARRALDLGLYISLSGIVTFPRAQTLREVAAFVPEDRLLLETDAPFLAPVPRRGQRNEPAWVVETFAAVARIRGVPGQALAITVADNFRRLTGHRS